MDQLEGVSSREMQAILQCVDDERNRRWMELGESTHMALILAFDSLPDPPVSPAAPLSFAAAASAPDDGVDHIGPLPDGILLNVVSRLPAKDAARTSALSSRWRAAPLTVVDALLLLGSGAGLRRIAAGGDDDDASLAVVAAASAALAAHPGPFRCVRLTWSHMASHRAEIARWLELLAAKGVQELNFINRPWPLDLPLPAALFSCASLTRLHIGAWKFPDTAALLRAAAFPHLRGLFLTMIIMTEQDLAFLLDRSPVLEALAIIARTNVRLRLVTGTKVRQNAIVPTIRILGLEVQFEVRNEVKTMPSFLKCFPNVETLHISSMRVDEPTGKVNLEFWQEAGPVECVQWHAKKLVFHGFQGKRSEVSFLKFIAEKAQVLEEMVIAVSPECFSSVNAVNAKLRPLTSAKWASEDFKLIVFKDLDCEDGSIRPWSFRMASEFSCSDPFDIVTDELSRGASVFHHP